MCATNFCLVIVRVIARIFMKFSSIILTNSVSTGTNHSSIGDTTGPLLPLFLVFIGFITLNIFPVLCNNVNVNRFAGWKFLLRALTLFHAKYLPQFTHNLP